MYKVFLADHFHGKIAVKFVHPDVYMESINSNIGRKASWYTSVSCNHFQVNDEQINFLCKFEDPNREDNVTNHVM